MYLTARVNLHVAAFLDTHNPISVLSAISLQGKHLDLAVSFLYVLVVILACFSAKSCRQRFWICWFRQKNRHGCIKILAGKIIVRVVWFQATAIHPQELNEFLELSMHNWTDNRLYTRPAKQTASQPPDSQPGTQTDSRPCLLTSCNVRGWSGDHPPIKVRGAARD